MQSRINMAIEDAVIYVVLGWFYGLQMCVYVVANVQAGLIHPDHGGLMLSASVVGT